jgi:hypothetical protein
MNKYADSYRAGYNVHWIQSSHAMREREAWRVGKLVHIGETELDVEIDGSLHRYYCYFAPDMKVAIDEGTPRGEDAPIVIVVEKWSLMMLPIGPKGSPPPDRISFYENAVSMGVGSTTEVLTPDQSYRMFVYSISRSPLE